MYEYRVTKYDPQYRVDGKYTREEWTSIADVGCEYDGKRFTMSEYERVERQHIDFLLALVQRERKEKLKICAYEGAVKHLQWESKEEIEVEELPALVRDILRERCWCRLSAPGFFIHFGYDYYMYVGCSSMLEEISVLARGYALFAEPMISPHYCAEDEVPIPNDLRSMTAIYLTRGEQILLLYRMGSRVVGNSYTGAAGGHMEAEEISSARACVLRELHEEIGLTVDALDGLMMRYVTMRLKNGEIRQNYYFFAELREGFEPQESNEGKLQWFRLDELAALPMPVTAKQVLLHYLDQGRHTTLLYGGISTEDGAVFTPLTEF